MSPEWLDTTASYPRNSNADIIDSEGKPVKITLVTHAEFCGPDVYSSFSGPVTYGIIPPGTILCRYAQQAKRDSTYDTEPGRYWTPLSNLPLNEKEFRTRLALRPEWNQDGILEVAVIPPGVSGYCGTCASQPVDSYEQHWLKGGATQYFIPRNTELSGLKECIMVIPNTHMPIADAPV
jgi:hypothetical protein